jgi:ribosomal protein L15
MSARGRKFPVIKIVGTADLPKVTVENCVLSASARAAFEKAGSTIA